MKEKILALLNEHRNDGGVWNEEEGQRVRCTCGAELPVSDYTACVAKHREHLAEVLANELAKG